MFTKMSNGRTLRIRAKNHSPYDACQKSDCSGHREPEPAPYRRKYGNHHRIPEQVTAEQPPVQIAMFTRRSDKQQPAHQCTFTDIAPNETSDNIYQQISGSNHQRICNIPLASLFSLSCFL